jgi:hypothetical protein
VLGMTHSRPVGYFHFRGQRKSFRNVTAASATFAQRSSAAAPRSDALDQRSAQRHRCARRARCRLRASRTPGRTKSAACASDVRQSYARQRREALARREAGETLMDIAPLLRRYAGYANGRDA